MYYYYRKYVISTGRISQLKFRKSMNSVLKQKLRITAVTTLRGYWLLLTRYSTVYSNVIHELFLQSGKSHGVTQFHILNWSSLSKSSSTLLQTIITVIEEVNKVQRRTDNKPIVVHCRSAALAITTNT